jgi:hypothetical protein
MERKVLWLVIVLLAGVLTTLPGCKDKPKEDEEKPASQEKAETKIVLTCGMAGHPQFEPGKAPEDGRCPQCEMKLIEKEIPSPKAD